MSGGIDSPAIAAYAAPMYREKMGRTLSALSHVYPEPTRKSMNAITSNLSQISCRWICIRAPRLPSLGQRRLLV